MGGSRCQSSIVPVLREEHVGRVRGHLEAGRDEGTNCLPVRVCGWLYFKCSTYCTEEHRRLAFYKEARLQGHNKQASIQSK